jgi:exodeoxyribonuclease-5
MNIELSAEQERARAAILSWFRSSDRKPWFYLQGYAGTGKSSVITATTSCIDGRVIYAAPTGKAALVMHRKGCHGARTLHSLLYRPAGMSGKREQIEQLRELKNLQPQAPRAAELRSALGKQFQEELKTLDPESMRFKLLTQALKQNLSNVKDLTSSNPLFNVNEESDLKGAELLVIDEISMVPKAVVEDALKFNVPILVQGDPGQLPPVMAQGFFTKVQSDFTLTEIHRQAKDSPIIYLATLAREGKTLPLGYHGDCLVTRDVTDEMAMGADQIIVGRHKTRHATNDKVRELLGFTGPIPKEGERVICRKNNHQLGLLNGDQFTVKGCKVLSVDKCIISVENEDLSLRCKAHRDYFEKKEPNPWTAKEAESFDFSYAITCHASQGSQWDNVFVRDESKYFAGLERQWLYTAASRAAKKLTIRV